MPEALFTGQIEQDTKRESALTGQIGQDRTVLPGRAQPA
jgi:hypothetical protein